MSNKMAEYVILDNISVNDRYTLHTLKLAYQRKLGYHFPQLRTIL